jgi:hypothetical protein
LTYSDSEPASAAKQNHNFDTYRNKELSDSRTIEEIEIAFDKQEYIVENENPCDISFASSNSISFERGRF